MKTAMQQFIEDNFYLNEENEYLIKFEEDTDYWADIKIALNREKEQIINAWIATDNELQRLAAEEYFNETYNNENL